MLCLLTRRSRRFASCLVLLGIAAPASAQSLWTVDAGGGGDFTEIQAAVDGSLDGDTIIVKDGFYGSFLVDDKALTIIAEGDGAFCGTIQIEDVSSTRTVLVKGLRATGAESASPLIACGLVTSDCTGTLRFVDCLLQAEDWPATDQDAWPGAWVVSCDDVAFSSCTMSAVRRDHPEGRAGHGLWAMDSRVAVYGSRCIGGSGGYFDIGTWLYAPHGGDGARVEGAGEFFAAATEFQGGDGGDDWYWVGTDGGHGLNSSQVPSRVLDCVAAGGLGGCSDQGLGGCDYGPDGLPYSGTVIMVPGKSGRSLTPKISPANSFTTFRFEGETGAKVFLLFSAGADHEYLDRWRGALLLAQPLLSFYRDISSGSWELPVIPLQLDSPYLGTIPAGGVLEVPVLVESPPSGAPAETFFLQGYVRNPSGGGALSDPAALTVVDDPGYMIDCNRNGIPDGLDLGTGTSLDCNLNGVPDECEWDCNANGIPDDCDLASGTSQDSNGDGAPDECEGLMTLYVDDDAPPGGSGISWTYALNDLQEALSFARTIPSEITGIWVAEGVYRPAGMGGATDSSFEVDPGMKLYGGFAGNETSLAQRVPFAHPTVLTGDLNLDDPMSSEDNATHVVTMTEPGEPRRLDGFVVTAGYATGWDTGAGVLVLPIDDWVIANCLIEGNHSYRDGGGLSIYGENGKIVNTIIRGNTARFGAGVNGLGCDGLQLVNCLIEGNEADATAGLRLYGPWDSPLPVELISCTIANNTATAPYATCGGIGLALSTATTESHFKSCIVWGNVAPAGTTEQQQIYEPDDLANAQYSCIQGLTALPGFHNHGLDPLFVNALGADGIAGTADDDVRLGAGSPCVDSSRNGVLPDDALDIDYDGDLTEQLPLDLAGNARRIDDPAVADTGSGVAPILDMGALERDPR